MNRIEKRFAQLKRAGKKDFIVYIGAGDPNLDATRELALAFDKAGVDILELGVPFSDPLADGLVNQLAAQRGLESGTTPPKLLETIVAIRKQSGARQRQAWTVCSFWICRRKNRTITKH
jgi:tryptophan synthase alpha chain